MATLRVPVRLTWASFGGPGVNVWHMRESGAGTAENLLADLEAFYDALCLTTVYPQQFTASFDGIAVDEADSEVRKLPAWVAGTGGSGNVHAPLIAQCMLTIRTSSATKAGLGRKFLGPLGAGAVEGNGTMNAAAVAAVQAAGNTLVAASVDEAEGAWGIYSRTQSLFRDMISVQARDYIGGLRSRRD